MAINKTVYFRYKLRDDGMAPATRMGVDGTNLSQTQWLVSKFKLDRLTKHVRSLNNPKGLVEMQEFDPFTNEVYATPALTPPTVIYTRDQLGVMTRDELLEIAHKLDIMTRGAQADMLVRKIIQEQQNYMKKEEQGG